MVDTAAVQPHRSERDLELELEAERAAKDHWRKMADQRSLAYERLSRHAVVRGLLAFDRRLEAIRRPVAAAFPPLRARLDRWALAAAALGRSGDSQLASVQTMLGRLPAPAVDSRRVLLLIVGQGGRADLPGTRHASAIQIPEAGGDGDLVGAVRRSIDESESDLVGIVLATSAPLDATWLARLTAAVVGDVVAATPVLLHPARPRRRATPHDGRVRSAGLMIDATSGGVPVVLAAGAGATLQPQDPPADVHAGSAACLLVERAAHDRVGGLPAADDLEVAVVELCTLLRAAGGRIVAVPSAALIDDRPVSSRRELRAPIDERGIPWRGAIDRTGPALMRTARPIADDVLRFAITVAAPSAEAAERWGDSHIAGALVRGLHRLGHQARVQTIDQADDLSSRACDVHVVIRGVKPVRRSAGQRHVLWIVSHPELVEDHELASADLVLVASPRFADHLRSRVATPVDVLLQATDHRRFRPLQVDPAHQHEVTVVADTRGVLRPAVADALAVGVRPCIYGRGWRDLVDEQLVAADYVENQDLPGVYSSAGVVVNDHWRTMQRWGFVSNRLYDVLACGTPVISDPVDGLVQLFDGGVLEYHTLAELRELVDHVLADPVAARERAARGRAAVLAAHTFDHRAEELVAALSRHAKPA